MKFKSNWEGSGLQATCAVSMNKRLLYEVHPTKGDEVSREGNEMKTAVFSVILILVSVLLFGIAFFALLSFITRSVSDTR